MRIVFEKSAFKDFNDYAQNNFKTYKRIISLIKRGIHSLE